MTEHCETSVPASRQLAKGEDSFRGQLSKVAAMTAGSYVLLDLSKLATKKLRVAEADVALESSLREAV